MNADVFLDPAVQYGFVGFAAVLLGLLAWLTRRLLSLLEATHGVISDNTHAIRSLDERSAELLRTTNDVRDRLLARRCLADTKG